MKLQLIENWRASYKYASIQFAALVAILAGIMSANPGMLLGLINYLPVGPMRTVAAVFVSLVVFVIPALTRILQKKPCPPKTDA